MKIIFWNPQIQPGWFCSVSQRTKSANRMSSMNSQGQESWHHLPHFLFLLSRSSVRGGYTQHWSCGYHRQEARGNNAVLCLSESWACFQRVVKARLSSDWGCCALLCCAMPLAACLCLKTKLNVEGLWALWCFKSILNYLAENLGLFI